MTEDYNDPWKFVHEKYNEMIETDRGALLLIDTDYWKLKIRGGNLEALYWVMKAHGVDFGKDDAFLSPPPTDAGALEYEDILAGEEIYERGRS